MIDNLKIKKSCIPGLNKISGIVNGKYVVRHFESEDDLVEVKEDIEANKTNGYILPLMKDFTLSEYVTCSDCEIYFHPYCYLCKEKAKIQKIRKRVDTPTTQHKRIKACKNMRTFFDYKIVTHENYHLASEGTFKQIFEIPEGFDVVFKSKGSKYYVDKDDTQLIRVSDHWGYNIKHCNWFLEGYNKMPCGLWKNTYGEKIGIINFNELKPVKIKQ